MPENDRDSARQSSRSGTEAGRLKPASGRHEMARSRSASSNGKPRRNAALTMVKPTVLAPIPRAMAAIAAADSQRSLIINRDAKRRS